MLPLEPPRLVPAAVDTHADAPFAPDPVLRDVDDSGKQIYSADEPNTAFAAAVHRLWDERGDFSKVSITSIADSSLPEEPQTSDPATQAAPSSSDAHLTPTQLWAIKSQLIHDIGIARQTAIQASHFLDLLIPSSTPNVPRDQDLTLPPNSFRTSSTTIPPPDPPPAVRAANLALTLSTTKSSLEQTAGLFRDASTRLQSQTQKSALWWKEWMDLRSNSVRIEARGARTGARLFGTMSELLAKEVVAFCGISHLDSSFSHWGHLAYAQLDFPKDDDGNDIPDSSPILKLPDRDVGRRRLKVSLYHNDKIVSQTTLLKFSSPSTTDVKNIEVVESAQQDFLDENLFECILQEAKKDGTAAFELRSDSISVQLAHEQTLTLSLERVDQQQQIEDNTDSNKSENQSSTLADLISSSLRIRFLKSRNNNPLPLRKDEKSTRPTNEDDDRILGPLTGLFSYYSQANKVLSVLQLLRDHLSQLGVHVSLNWKPAITSARQLFGFSSSPSSPSSSLSPPSLPPSTSCSIGGLGSLLVDSCHSIQISISPPTSVHFHSSMCSVAVSSSGHLNHLLSTEMSHYIQSKWIPKLHKLPSSVKISVDYSLQTGFAVGTLIKTDDSNNNAKRTNNHSDTLNVWSAASSEESFQDWLRRSIEV